jgi:predicted transposase YdaD
MADRREQSNVAASAAILAGLVLEKRVIEQLLRQEIMRESVIYQEIRAEGKAEGTAEGKAEGKQEGKAEGKQEGEASLVLRLLKKRLGGVSLDLEQQVRGLSVEQLENLGEALLDFAALADLVDWLNCLDRT